MLEWHFHNDNLLKGQFDRKEKNEVWVTDTTEIKYGNSGHKASRSRSAILRKIRTSISSNKSMT